jgi:amidase
MDQFLEIADKLGMSVTDSEAKIYLENIAGTCAAYDAIDQTPDYLPEVKYPRGTGYRPSPNENPYNAWYWKSEVKGAKSGPLSGKKIALKDNVCLAGVPMMNGASTLEGYVPEIDATIVTRILDAGGTIAGKAVCEYFCLSGGSHTSSPGPVINPRKPGYSAGGSSSGSAALVAAGEVDMAIGGDQGGSIRIPASYSGVYGMKPTHGLVPYTGIMPIEVTIDHTGPLTANVADNALLLESLAGEDGMDPRQYSVKTAKYTEALGKGVSGMRIGVVTEGFGHENSEPDVDASVRKAAKLFEKMQARVEEVSVPMHLLGGAIWTPIAIEGLHWQMMLGNGFGMNWKGLYLTSLMDRHAQWRERADELSPTLKLCMFIGEWFINQYNGRFYGKSQNLARMLRETYDKVLQDYDLLLMPTLPLKATKLPAPDAEIDEIIARGLEMIANTSPFDVTGHPSMNVPCGIGDGRPIGMMLTAKHFDEAKIYQAAHAFEQADDWEKM